MRDVQRVLCGLGLLGAASSMGCSAEEAVESVAVARSGAARVVLVGQGSASANLHLTATDDATSETALDRSLNVDTIGPLVVDLSLPAARYTLHLDAFSDRSHSRLLSSGEAPLDLSTDLAPEIFLMASTDGKRKGIAGIDVTIHDMPHIEGITVAHSKGSVTVDVDASTSTSGALSYFWSGYGIDGAVKGSSSLTLSAKDALASAGAAVSHLVVQTRAGATASIDIDLVTTQAGEACVFCDAPATSEPVPAPGGPSPSVDVQACLKTRVQCDLACQAAASLDAKAAAAPSACLTQCGLALAACESAVD